MIDYRVYLVTDDPSRYRRDWLETVEAALEGGVTCVQYRDTENEPKMQYERILRLRDLTRFHQVGLIVNNDASLAAAVNADGVHVGQGDLPPAQVRAIVGARCEIGLSITDLRQVVALKVLPRGLVDVIGIGPVYDARATKHDAADALGQEGLRAVVEATDEFRNVAIGGITLARAAQVVAAGAQGLAIVTALSQAEDPRAAAAAFREVFS